MPRASSFLALSVAASSRAMVSRDGDDLLLARGQARDADAVDDRAGVARCSPRGPASRTTRTGVDFCEAREPWRAYLTDWLRGTVRMYAESAWRYVARMVNAVTGRSFSTTVCADTGARR